MIPLLLLLAFQVAALPPLSRLPRDRDAFDALYAEQASRPDTFLDRHPELAARYDAMKKRVNQVIQRVEAREPIDAAAIDQVFDEFLHDNGHPDLNTTTMETLSMAWRDLANQAATRMSPQVGNLMVERTRTLLELGAGEVSPEISSLMAEALLAAPANPAPVEDQAERLLADAFEWAVEIGNDYQQQATFSICRRRWGDSFDFAVGEALLGEALPDGPPAEYLAAVEKLRDLMERIQQIDRQADWGSDFRKTLSRCLSVPADPPVLRADLIAKYLLVTRTLLSNPSAAGNDMALAAADRGLAELLREQSLTHPYHWNVALDCVRKLGPRRASHELKQTVRRIAAGAKQPADSPPDNPAIQAMSALLQESAPRP